MIETRGLTKAEVYWTLYNNAIRKGATKDDRSNHNQPVVSDKDISIAQAEVMVKEHEPELFFGYINGRLLDLDLSKRDIFDETRYDASNGEGSAQYAIDKVKVTA